MGGALEDKMVGIKKVGAVLFVLWHGGKALEGEERGAGPFPATTGQFLQTAVQERQKLTARWQGTSYCTAAVSFRVQMPT